MRLQQTIGVLSLSLFLFIAGCGTTGEEIEVAPDTESHSVDSVVAPKVQSQYYFLVTHRINDLSNWKKEFALMENERRKVGLTQITAFTTFIDSSTVCVLFKTGNEVSSMEFAHSEDNIEALQRVGTVSPPDIRTMVVGEQFPESEMNSAYYILIQHPVADYKRWEGVFKLSRQKREEHYLKDLGIFTRSEDKKDIAVLIAAASLENASIYASSLQSADLLEAAGVSALPSILVMVPFDVAPDVK